MKKIMAPFLLLCFILSFAGCALKQPEYHSNIATQPPTEETTISSDTNINYEQKPMYSVSLPIEEQNITADDGTVICKTFTQNISLVVSDPEVADKIIVDFLNRVDIEDNSKTLISAAQAAYKANKQNWTPFLLQVSYDPVRIDQSILSLTGTRVAYEGLPHPDVTYASVTYDLVNGNTVALSDILIDAGKTDNLCDAVITALRSQYTSANNLYEGFEQTVKERFAKSLMHDQGWHFSASGLVIYFSPYEIAPYSLGAVSVEIPYTQLVGIMKDEFFPGEREDVVGTVCAEPFSQDKLDRFTQFAEIVINQNPDKIVLYTEQTVYNLTLQTGFWNADGSVFTADHTVFASASLTPGDAIIVEDNFPQGQPTLLLSYESNGKTVSAYLSVDKAAGTIQMSSK